MPDLPSIVHQEISRKGVITFHRFMELALYCPEFGYYERAEATVGKGGDFITSVSIGNFFGHLLAFQFAHWCEDFSGSVQWVEAGAHDGKLAADLLSAAREHSPELFERLVYCIVEPSERRQSWQSKRLGSLVEKVKWVRSLEDLVLEGVNGVIFSNELLDAFPVHRLAWVAARKRWFEWGVGYSGGRLDWRMIMADSHDWSSDLRAAGFDIPQELAEVIPDGFVLEFSPQAGKWWSEAAGVLSRGRLMTIDYGLLVEQFLLPERCHGTLRAYRGHTVGSDFFSSPGEQDLTAHVNFSQLIRAGEMSGLRTDEFTPQSEFLSNLARRMWLNSSSPSSSQVRQFQSLTHPEHLGRVFRVLIQSRTP